MTLRKNINSFIVKITNIFFLLLLNYFTFWKFSFKTNLFDVLMIDFFPVFHHKEITHHINPLNINLFSIFTLNGAISVYTKIVKKNMKDYFSLLNTWCLLSAIIIFSIHFPKVLSGFTYGVTIVYTVLTICQLV